MSPPSLNLTISHKHLITTDGEYQSFVHIYQSVIPKVHLLVHRIVSMLDEIKVGSVVVDGRKIGILAVNEFVSPKELVECLMTEDVRLRLLEKIDKYDGTQGMGKAASKIQAVWRMSGLRREYLEFKRGVVVIQRYAKKYISKLQLKKTINQRNSDVYNDFLLKQHKMTNDFEHLRSSSHV